MSPNTGLYYDRLCSYNNYFLCQTKECPEGYYGVNCAQDCTCITENTESCNNVDGTCTCKPGFIGDICDSECPEGYYGANCAQACTCEHENTESCNNVDGTCTCKPGFFGNICDSACSDTTYGENCAQTCTCVPE